MKAKLQALRFLMYKNNNHMDIITIYSYVFKSVCQTLAIKQCTDKQESWASLYKKGLWLFINWHMGCGD